MLIYDGDCGFCSTTAAWIGNRLPKDVAVKSWQSLELETLGLTTDEVSSAAYWIDTTGDVHRGHLAIGRALQAAGGIWRPVGLIIRTPPVSWLAAPCYTLLARYRYKLPGSTDACRL